MNVITPGFPYPSVYIALDLENFPSENTGVCFVLFCAFRNKQCSAQLDKARSVRLLCRFVFFFLSVR